MTIIQYKTISVKDPSFSKSFEKMQKIGCFLYEMRGIKLSELENYFSGKILEMFTVQKRIGSFKKCPFCEQTSNDMENHLATHGKTLADVTAIKASQEAYSHFLKIIRRGNYDALLFSVNVNCPFCETPFVEDREGKCAIPESSRNKFRSLRHMGFSCAGFSSKDKSIPKNTFAVIYKRRPNARRQL